MVKAPQFIGMGRDIAGIHITDLPPKGVPQGTVTAKEYTLSHTAVSDLVGANNRSSASNLATSEPAADVQ